MSQCSRVNIVRSFQGVSVAASIQRFSAVWPNQSRDSVQCDRINPGIQCSVTESIQGLSAVWSNQSRDSVQCDRINPGTQCSLTESIQGISAVWPQGSVPGKISSVDSVVELVSADSGRRKWLVVTRSAVAAPQQSVLFSNEPQWAATTTGRYTPRPLLARRW